MLSTRLYSNLPNEFTTSNATSGNCLRIKEPFPKQAVNINEGHAKFEKYRSRARYLTTALKLYKTRRKRNYGSEMKRAERAVNLLERLLHSER